MRTITPCLWFDGKAEEAARFYTSLLPDSHVDKVLRSPGNYPSGKGGDVLTVEFTLMGRPFVGLNGGPHFKFNESVSFLINCKTQAEVDKFWEKLSKGGQKSRCGWLKDKYGLSWQIVPEVLSKLMSGKDRTKAKRVMDAVMKMDKLIIKDLEKAYKGK